MEKEQTFVFSTREEFKFNPAKMTDEEAMEAIIEQTFKNGGIPAAIEFHDASRNVRLGTLIIASHVGEKLARKLGYQDKGKLFGDKILVPIL